MRPYTNTAANARIAALEFRKEGRDTVAFIQLAPHASLTDVRALLAAPPVSARIVAQTSTEGKRVMVVHSAHAPNEFLGYLAQLGETLQHPSPEKKPFNPWAWRGYTSLLGQSLQIISSYATIGNKSDSRAVFGFASLNILANAINILFGSQEKHDPHHLRVLKQTLNDRLAPLGTVAPLPDSDDHRLSRRPQEAATLGSRLGDWLEKYSVSFGEIMLRTLGAISLAFPITQWKGAAATYKDTKSWRQAFAASKNTNPATFLVGLATLAGKFVSFLSSEPDPYNPKPPGLLRQFREKITFRLSSLIEGGAAAYMGYDRMKHQRVRIAGKEHPDYYGGLGNAVFIGGYVVRFSAPYGSRIVDMRELYAHVSDSLALLPRAQLPDALLDAAVYLQQHFKDAPLNKKQPTDLPSIYQGLCDDLAKAHHIRLDAPMHVPASPTSAVAASPSPKPHITEAHAHSKLKEAPELAAMV
jgi:hypothetical protein